MSDAQQTLRMPWGKTRMLDERIPRAPRGTETRHVVGAYRSERDEGPGRQQPEHPSSRPAGCRMNEVAHEQRAGDDGQVFGPSRKRQERSSHRVAPEASAAASPVSQRERAEQECRREGVAEERRGVRHQRGSEERHDRRPERDAGREATTQDFVERQREQCRADADRRERAHPKSRSKRRAHDDLLRGSRFRPDGAKCRQTTSRFGDGEIGCVGGDGEQGWDGRFVRVVAVADASAVTSGRHIVGDLERALLDHGASQQKARNRAPSCPRHEVRERHEEVAEDREPRASTLRASDRVSRHVSHDRPTQAGTTLFPTSFRSAVCSLPKCGGTRRRAAARTTRYRRGAQKRRRRCRARTREPQA